MIGDVVGLGKTITACAIAKMYENTFGSNTLIICPANLQDMWEKYRNQYEYEGRYYVNVKNLNLTLN